MSRSLLITEEHGLWKVVGATTTRGATLEAALLLNEDAQIRSKFEMAEHLEGLMLATGENDTGIAHTGNTT